MKNLFIPENSGYGRFVTVTVNGKPYTVPVGVNTSVSDEVYSVVMESLKKPETNTHASGLYSIPNDISLSDSHLQLTANGEAVGNGVAIPAPKETFVKTYFDYTKLKDVLVGNNQVFSITHNLDITNTKDVIIRFKLIKEKLDESTGEIAVQPVLTGLPSVIYGRTVSERTFDSNEKVGITLRVELEGQIYNLSEKDFKEIFSKENTVFNIDSDVINPSFIVIAFVLSADYNDIDTANAIKSSIKDEILTKFRGLQVAVDRVEWTEKESELVYVE